MPSTKAQPGWTLSCSTARFIARKVAWKMLISSISSALAQPIPQARAFSWMRGNRASRFFLRQLFGIVQPVNVAIQGQNHRRGAHGPSQGAPARLVDPADRPIALLLGPALPGKPVKVLREACLRCYVPWYLPFLGTLQSDAPQLAAPVLIQHGDGRPLCVDLAAGNQASPACGPPASSSSWPGKWSSGGCLFYTGY